jgi:hypothetical protein
MDNQDVQELFQQMWDGEITVLDLMDELDTSGFDGDIIDFL